MLEICGKKLNTSKWMLLMVMVFIFLLPGISLAQTVNLPGTGQMTCYDESGIMITCTNTGQDGEIQAGAAWPDPRFQDNGDGTVTDRLTGLMWLKDGGCLGAGTWSDALAAVDSFNSSPGDYGCTDHTAAYTDWRLPNVNELKGLINAEESDTAAWLNDSAQGFSDVQSNSYWSSTTYAFDNGYAWHVNMWAGGVFFGIKTGNSYAWAVRAASGFPAEILKTGQTTCYDGSGTQITCADTGQDGEIQAGAAWPDPRFTDNGDGTVTDDLTGLMWTQDANAPGPAECTTGTTMIWQDALDYAACLNTNSYLGYTDWRLPNRNELHSLTDLSQFDPALPSNHPFTNVQWNNYWSSTAYAGNTGFVWDVNMLRGVVSAVNKVGSKPVWPVRAGILYNADIMVEKTDSPDPVAVGSDITYTVTITNNGPDDATGVTLTDTLPGSVTYISATPDQGNCIEAVGIVTCDIEDITNGANVTITIVITPLTAGTITNTADASANEFDSDDTNNSISEDTTVKLYTLTVTTAGTGSGTVASSPAGIECGSDCTEVYDDGISVTLTATPDTGSVFASWGGDADCSDGSVTMDADKTCTANFDPNSSPYIPELLYPADGQRRLPTTLTFGWKQATDPDGDPVTYDIYYCEDPDPYNNCAPVETASLANQGESMFYASANLLLISHFSKRGLGGVADSDGSLYSAGILLLGIIFAGGVSRRKRIILHIAVIVAVGILLVSCGGGGGSSWDTGTADETYTASDLNLDTQYYWQVVAKDGNSGETLSDVWEFTTM